ncbi:MAG: isoamylase, partial [Paraburkholderia sp.]|nr:isoamylase [Paraburkholderia sp.]
RVLQMVMDSLRYWVTQFHVDGFRFDLGVTLGREPNGFDSGAGFFDALRQDPILSRVKLISEPWDIGPGGYQLGHHPPGFAEWNDRYRDGTRRFWRGDAGQRGELAARISGSSDLFDRRARRPWASVNFVASHDGYTTADIVSYVNKHNEANGEDNRDGHSENYSANWGVEGPSDDPAIKQTRTRVQRALLATLLFSHGTPMLLAGDEFGRTQRGNNNAYCQDNEISWLDWKQAEAPEAQELARYVARLVRLRHDHPVLRCRHFLHGNEIAPGLLDVAWFDTRGEIISSESWNNPEERVLALRRASADGDGTVSILTLFLNPNGEDQLFTMPPPELPTRLLLDSADPAKTENDIEGRELVVAARSVMLTQSVRRADPT